MSLVLNHTSGSTATIIPHRGGLLSNLQLMSRSGATASVIWLPQDFNEQESGWPGGGMPLLFPFAGRLFHNGTPLYYRFAERTWRMPLHGFAYAQPWQVTAASAEEATLTLESSLASRELYPFDFRVQVRYELSSSTLKAELTVTNLGGLISQYQRMPFALGWHPYLRQPIGQGGSLIASEDQISLKVEAASQTRVTPQGAAGRTSAFPEPGDPLAPTLKHPYWHNLILGDHRSPFAQIKDASSRLAIEVAWSEDFQYLVLWTRPNAEGQREFHCIEPWMGLPDALSNNAGLCWLEPNEARSSAISLALKETSN